ncbi:hypothetical protein POM88_022317 [Heracleum sosnowskyi]|uniref:MADS-box domain-containing protein n=1 Tax=Heracleum sosnowskyi TaxID=360622 RepID=A0AAD8IHL9_9APIA|nr:hypothetical protein POM88_022317 [Heracleum sosnowskyi]
MERDMDGGNGRKIEFIENEKKRNSTLMIRKKGLINQANQLSVLCGVESCVIIKNNDAIDLVWSSSSDMVLVGDLISKFKQQSGPKNVYGVPTYYENKRKAGKKRNRGAVELPTWNPKFESMSECELRNFAAELEVKLNNLKNRKESMSKTKRRRKTVRSDCSTIDDQVATQMDSIVEMDSMNEARMEEPMNLIQDCNFDNSIEDSADCSLQLSPKVAMDSLDQMKAAMNSIEDNACSNLDMNPIAAVNSLDQAVVTDSFNPQPIAMTKPDDVNKMTPAMSDDNTLMDLQQQYLYDPSNPFVNYNSGDLCLWKFSNGKLCSKAIIQLFLTASSDALILFYKWLDMFCPRCKLLNRNKDKDSNQFDLFAQELMLLTSELRVSQKGASHVSLKETKSGSFVASQGECIYKN